MTLMRTLAASALLPFTILLVQLDDVFAQTAQVCTNFTCRYGECEQYPLTYKCHCPAQVKGDHCEYKMLPTDSLCLSNPCWNGGTCAQIGNDYFCSCPSGATGKDCRQITTAACLTSNPCRNNAVCMVTPVNGVMDSFCVCAGPWTGKFCDVSLLTCNAQAPCFNGGSCINSVCVCPQNFTGYQCQTFVAQNTDHVVKILNKGWYSANVRVDYQLQQNLVKFPVQQKATLASGNDYGFYIPHSVVLEGEIGIVLTAEAIGGVRIFSVRVPSDPSCVHIWGTTLIPYWSFIDCDKFKS